MQAPVSIEVRDVSKIHLLSLALEGLEDPGSVL